MKYKNRAEDKMIRPNGGMTVYRLQNLVFYAPANFRNALQ